MKNFPAFIAACLAAFLSHPAASGPTRADHNPKLLGLEANRWIRFHQGPQDGWRREGHVGMIYDSKRRTLVFFGSGTHGKNWDNAVHEFDPVSERWTTHYRSAAPDTYGADRRGNRVAGRGRDLPWAMHAYDGIVYDPRQDAMILAAKPVHNPKRKALPAAERNPVWMYDLGARRWRVMESGGAPAPTIFSGGSAYDSARDTIVLSRHHGRRGEVWELGPDRRRWVRAWRGRQQHGIHVNMGYDSKNRKIVVFGAYRATETVAVYTPGGVPGEPGRWRKSVPRGDSCPKVTKTPIAYSERHGVFLIVPRIGKTRKTATCVYDAASHRYRRIRGAEVERGHMNFMMAYDAGHDVFLLVTGNWHAPPVVWAFRFDPLGLD